MMLRTTVRVVFVAIAVAIIVALLVVAPRRQREDRPATPGHSIVWMPRRPAPTISRVPVPHRPFACWYRLACEYADRRASNG